MAKQFGTLPEGAKNVEPFTANVPDEEVAAFKEVLRHSKIIAPSYENTQEDRRYGVTRAWMANAKEYWLKEFDWRASEKHINSFPNFVCQVEDENEVYKVHFAVLFSKKPDAVPVMSIHGWPGSFLEYLPLLTLVAKEYTPETLPYHLIVPSIPGSTYSSDIPTGKSLEAPTAARILDKVMANLGFTHGYIATGGDIGSSLSRILASNVSQSLCKGMLVNFCPMMEPPNPVAENSLSEQDHQMIKQGKKFYQTGAAYAMEHGTRTSTIGLILGSNPLALLAWVGEKYLEWSDEDPSLDTILEAVSLYWFTDTSSRNLYTYRQRFEGKAPVHNNPSFYVEKPFGYSLFPKELIPTPKAWVETTGKLSFFRQHQSGGHFAAMERPAESKQDMEDFLEHVKQRGVKFSA